MPCFLLIVALFFFNRQILVLLTHRIEPTIFPLVTSLLIIQPTLYLLNFAFLFQPFVQCGSKCIFLFIIIGKC